MSIRQVVRLALALSVVPLTISIAAARNDSNTWETTIHTQNDMTLDVVDAIGDTPGHLPPTPLVRNIYKHYTNQKGEKFNVEVTFDDVTDGNGQKCAFTKKETDDCLSIDVQTGPTMPRASLYKIHYTVKGAIRPFSAGQEICWQVVPSDWTIPLKFVEALVYLPDGTELMPLAIAGFLGDDYGTNADSYKAADGVAFRAKDVPAHTKMIFDLRSPGPVVQKPPFGQEVTSALMSYMAVIISNFDVWLLPLVVFIGSMLYWWRSSAEQAGGFEPRNISDWTPSNTVRPAELRALLRPVCDSRASLCALLDLANRGFISIKDLGNDIEMSLGRMPNENELMGYEKVLLQGIFGESYQASTKLSALSGSLRRLESAVCSSMEPLIQQKSTVPDQHHKPREECAAAGGAALILGIIAGYCGEKKATTAFLLSGLILFACSKVIPGKRAVAERAVANALSFSHIAKNLTAEEAYISVRTEPGTFARLLPYAFATGASDHWLSVFENLPVKSPPWYAAERQPTAQALVKTIRKLQAVFDEFDIAKAPANSE